MQPSLWFMRHIITTLLIGTSLVFGFTPASAYTLRYTDASGAVRVRWPSNTITVMLSASLLDPPANIKATSGEVQNSVFNALRRWEKAANITFIIASSTRLSVNLGEKSDSINLITIAHTPENSKFFNGAHSRDVARTRTLHDDNGALLEADIALNPAQLFSADGAPGTYDLEAIFTHELGHLLGLGESSILGATMSPRQGWNGLYHSVAWSGRSLSTDDIGGLNALYGSRQETEASGMISGNLTWPGGQPAFGINVWAEEWTTGRVVASTITLSKGEYRLEGLRLGLTYRLVAGALTGLLKPADFSGANAGYSGLQDLATLPAFTEELKLITLQGSSGYASKQLREPTLKAAQPTLIGINGELADVSVALTAGQTYTLLVTGENMTAEKLLSVSVGSPFFIVSKNSLKIWDDKRNSSLAVPALSFVLEVSANAPVGDYSLRFESADGVVVLPGVITVETSSFAGRLVSPRLRDDLAARPFAETAANPSFNGSMTLLSVVADGNLKDK